MAFYALARMAAELVTPNYSTAAGGTIRGEKIEVGCYRYPPRTGAKSHAHPNEQVISVLSGRLWCRVGAEERVLGPGEVMHVLPMIEHQVIAGDEEVSVISCKDVVPGWSVRDARWEADASPPETRWEPGSFRQSGAAKPFSNWRETERSVISPQYSTAEGPTIKGVKIEIGRYRYSAGTGAKPHRHPQEQVIALLAGKLRIRVGTEERVLGPEEAVHVPPMVEHEAWTVDGEAEILSCKDVMEGHYAQV